MPVIGALEPYSGNVSTLNAIAPACPARVEDSLGFRRGRLAEGYCLAVLKEALTPDDFEFEGTTVNSGGRWGLPSKNLKNDGLRPRVHDSILLERGHQGYLDLQRSALQEVAIVGTRRIIKILPVTPHDQYAAPDLQYPPGGGGLQWRIKRSRPKRFFVALFVDNSAFAHSLAFSISIREDQSTSKLYAAKRLVAGYLQTT